jgi:hypothetical protein
MGMQSRQHEARFFIVRLTEVQPNGFQNDRCGGDPNYLCETTGRQR